MRNALYCFALIFFTTIGISRAQIEGSAFNATGRGGTATTFVTDYQAIGINPANLGFDNDFSISFGVGELGYSFYSDALLRDDVRAIVFNNDDTITQAEEETIANAFVENGMAFNLDVMPIGLSFKIPKFGTIAFSYTVNANYHSKFGGQAPQIIFEGYNYEEYFDTVIVTPDEIYAVAYDPLSLSDLFDGTDISFNAKSEINLAYGTELISTDKMGLYAGIGIKYIMSHAYMNFLAENGTITGVSALGLDILELTTNQTNPITSNALQPVGTGWGFDLGASIKLDETLTLGASITDMGKVDYTANLLQLNDYVLDTLRFSGVTSTDPIKIIDQILTDENIVAYSGLSSFSESLPTNLRLGASLKLGEFLDVGVDGVFPMNDVAGAYASPLFGIGGQLTLFKILKPSIGLTSGGGYATNIPAGLTFDFQIWEAGIASRDILTWFGEARPNVSVAFGFLRFKI